MFLFCCVFLKTNCTTNLCKLRICELGILKREHFPEYGLIFSSAFYVNSQGLCSRCHCEYYCYSYFILGMQKWLLMHLNPSFPFVKQ
jgi:hypothetical protein